MKISELRQMNEKKLLETLDKVKRELEVTRFHVKTGQEQNTAKIKDLKVAVAQIHTLLTQVKNSSKVETA